MKKTFYTILTVFLSLQLSFLVHGLIEWIYIKITLDGGGTLSNTHFLGKLYCVLPWWLNHGLLLVALIGGYFLAQVWWRIVYIEKRRRRGTSQSEEIKS